MNQDRRSLLDGSVRGALSINLGKWASPTYATLLAIVTCRGALVTGVSSPGMSGDSDSLWRREPVPGPRRPGWAPAPNRNSAPTPDRFGNESLPQVSWQSQEVLFPGSW